MISNLIIANIHYDKEKYKVKNEKKTTFTTATSIFSSC